jgi:peptide deformylase
LKPKIADLRILHYPDPRLRRKAAEVKDFDASLAELAARMFELMKTAEGVGLAAPQVGVALRLFVMNATGEEKDRLVFINPVLDQLAGAAEAEEGCLSLPGINVQVKRAARARVRAFDLAGKPFTLEAGDLPARVWQHETDHLNGVLIIDRMGPADRIATRKVLKALEQGRREPA